MNRCFTIILILLSISIYSQEADYLMKIDSLNSLIDKNNKQISLLQKVNKELNSDIQKYNQELNSLPTSKSNSVILKSVSFGILYKDEKLKERVENIPNGAAAVLIKDLGNKYKVRYNGVIGYTHKYVFKTDSERQKKNRSNSDIQKYNQELNSLPTSKSNSIILKSVSFGILYKDEKLKERVENIPNGTIAVLIEDLGDKYKVRYEGKIGYTHKYVFKSNSGKQNKNEAPKKIVDEERLNQMVSKYGSKYGKIVTENYYDLGMTKEMIIDSIGEPNDINKTTGPWGTHEQWVYKNLGVKIYFDNGKVTSFQD